MYDADNAVRRILEVGKALTEHGSSNESMRQSVAHLRLAAFDFGIRHFGSFRRFPLLVHSFDVFLRVVTAITAPFVLREIADLTREVAGWRDVTLSRHRFGGREFDYHGIELGHVHSNGVVDVRLTRTEHDDVIARSLAQLHHVAPNSSWVTLVIANPGDGGAAARLLKIALQRLERGGTSEAPIEERLV